MKTPATAIPVNLDGGPRALGAAFKAAPGTQPLYFKYVGDGSVDFLSFPLK